MSSACPRKRLAIEVNQNLECRVPRVSRAHGFPPSRLSQKSVIPAEAGIHVFVIPAQAALNRRLIGSV